MSDGSTESRQNDPELHAAQAESELVRKEADTVFDVAISQAAHRDAAELVARNAAYIRHATEMAALNVKARAERERFEASETAEESSALRRNLVRERKAASNMTFGLMIASVLLIIGLIAGGVYYFSSQNSAVNGASAGVTPGVVASATSSAKSSDVSAPAKTPTTIHVTPAPARSESPLQGDKAESAAPPVSGSLGDASAEGLTNTNASADSGNLSGAALNSDGIKTAVGPGANSGGDVVLPASDAGTNREPKTDRP